MKHVLARCTHLFTELLRATSRIGPGLSGQQSSGGRCLLLGIGGRPGVLSALRSRLPSLLSLSEGLPCALFPAALPAESQPSEDRQTSIRPSPHTAPAAAPGAVRGRRGELPQRALGRSPSPRAFRFHVGQNKRRTRFLSWRSDPGFSIMGLLCVLEVLSLSLSLSLSRALSRLPAVNNKSWGEITLFIV